MREIILDTETTGLDPSDGHRLVEICCLELDNHLATGRVYQTLIQPERDIPEEAVRVHGLTAEKLADAPLFAAIADEFLAFIGESRLVIHNAEFDMKFLNAELGRINRPLIPAARALDTIALARRRFPGARYSLDELCRRFNIDLSGRTKHGARVDAELLALVYLELIGGRQSRLQLAPNDARGTEMEPARKARPRPVALAGHLTPEEREAHKSFVAAEIEGDAIWTWSA